MSNGCHCNHNEGCCSKNKKSSITSSAEEGCNKNKKDNPKSATNNQWC